MMDLADLPAEYDELFAAYDDLDTSDTDADDLDSHSWPARFSPPSSPSSTLPSHASTPSFSSSTSSASFSTASLNLDSAFRADSPLLGFQADATTDPLHFPCPGFIRDLAADKPPTARFRASSLSQQSPLPPCSRPTRRQSHLHSFCATPDDIPARASRRAVYIDSEAVRARLSELLSTQPPSPSPERDTRATPTQMYAHPHPPPRMRTPSFLFAYVCLPLLLPGVPRPRGAVTLESRVQCTPPLSRVACRCTRSISTRLYTSTPTDKEAKQTRRKRLVSFISRFSTLPAIYDPPVPIPVSGAWSVPTSPLDTAPAASPISSSSSPPKQSKAKPPKPLKPKSKGKRRRLLVSGVPLGAGADAVFAVRRWAEGFGELREFRRVDPAPPTPRSAPASLSHSPQASRRRGLFSALSPLVTATSMPAPSAGTEEGPVENGTTSLVVDWRDRAVSETVCRVRARVVIRGAGSVTWGGC
ncbi:hypothetical protein BD779DRAFT_1547003, partial [Infundibulicybe gibba]